MMDFVFPDGSVRQFEAGTTGRQIAASIAKSLEKKAVLVRLDGKKVTKRQLTRAA